jgi:outer membrane protein TolC
VTRASTGGTAAQRAQLEAFREQFLYRRREFLAGKTTLDDLLETERFLSQADANCGATREERRAARHLSFVRLREIDEVCKKRFAAGQITRADLAQVEAQRRLVEEHLEDEQEK